MLLCCLFDYDNVWLKLMCLGLNETISGGETRGREESF